MQNFTLRFKGKLYYLLILTFLVGSLPSIYGQSCPTVDQPSQSFCDALSTVADLDANGDNVQWYDEAGSTTPLRMDEILKNGEDYFTDSPDCTDPTYTRESVTVTITGPAMPTVMDDFFTPCSGGGPYTIADLKEAIDASAPPSGYTLEIFPSRYGKDDSPYADTDPLTVGNYYAGFYDGSTCQSQRKPVRFEPVEANAPVATSPQTVCEGTTVSELEAEGTNLWYRTTDSQPALPDDFEVQNGMTYYASQIVPSDGPPCESEERTAVTVTVLPADAGEDNTDNTLCVSDADSQLNDETNARSYFLSLLENNFDADPSNDVPTTGDFDMAKLTEIVADYKDGTKTGTYQTTYTVTFSNGCEDSVILGVTVAEDPNPGTDREQDVCISDIAPLVPLAAANISLVEDEVRSYLGGTGIDPGGEFTPDISDFIATLSNDIDNDNFPKTYTIDYTVNNNGCEKTATATLNVFPDNDAGTSDLDEMCETDVDDAGIFTDENSLKAYYLELLGTDDDSGNFNPPLSTLITNYSDVTDPSEDFTTEYTVDNGICAPASATATLTVTKVVPADAGTSTGDNYCSNENTDLDLYSFLSGDYGSGTFSSDNAEVADATFNPSEEGVGSYDITYTVSPDTDCVTGTAFTTFTIEVFAENNAGTSDSKTLCETDVDDQAIFTDENSLKAYYLELLGTDDDSGNFNPPLSTLITNYSDVTDPSEDFTTEYTVDNGVCAPAMATATLTVTKVIPANAGTSTGDNYCSNENTDLDLYSFLSGDYGSGTFSSDNAEVADATFNPSEEGVGSYDITYTVSPDTDCVTGTAFTTFTIKVNLAPNAGPGGDFSFCQGEFDDILKDPITAGQKLLNELGGDDITLEGTFSDDNLSTLITKYKATTELPATFTTTYTVDNSDCTDAATYSITITPNTEVNAGGSKNIETPICSTDGIQDLSSYLGDGATTGGVFSSDNITITDGMYFDPSMEGAGDYSVTYSVNGDSDPCLTGQDEATITFDIVEGIDIPLVDSKIICDADIDENFFNEEDLTAYYLGLLDDDIPTEGGAFNPDIPTVIQNYNNGDTTLTTVYSLNNEPCNNSVELTIIIRDNITAELTEVDNPDPICQNEDLQDLTDFIGDNPDFGRFEGYEDGTFNPGILEAGIYPITYILDEEASCVTGSAFITFEITVKESANAGELDQINICQNSGLLRLFQKLGSTVDKTGEFTFTTTGEVIEDGELNPSTLIPDIYSITYTVPSENSCGDDSMSFNLNVRSVPNAGVGTSDPEPVCQNLDSFDLFTLVDTEADMTGSFRINGNTIDSNINPSDYEAGTTYNFNYFISDSQGFCSDSAIIQVTILSAANAGDGGTINACSNDSETINLLLDYVSVDADQNGEFTFEETGEVIENGEIIPSELDPAAYNYTIVYTVPAMNDCGNDIAEFELNIEEAPDAPEINSPISFCAILNPTGADLMVEGETLTFYSDAELSTMVTAEQALTSGTYYVTQRNTETSCESDATEFTVTINDPGTPTIDDTNQTFCKYDDATIADLNDAVEQTSNVSWYDSAEGTEPFSTGTALQDGVTYYASLYDPETDCDSSARLAVTVTIEDCPLLFPEGISPNGDGSNDTFNIENIEREYPNYTISIRNRWGDLIYKGNANTPDWDGTTNQSGSLGDDVLPVGVYFYLLDFNDGVTAPRRGKIYLSR